jgi:hypothetical protein
VKHIQIYYNTTKNKWIADPIHQQHDAAVGIGSTPLEALGDLICQNCNEYGISVTKIAIKRSDLTDPPSEALRTRRYMV